MRGFVLLCLLFALILVVSEAQRRRDRRCSHRPRRFCNPLRLRGRWFYSRIRRECRRRRTCGRRGFFSRSECERTCRRRPPPFPFPDFPRPSCRNIRCPECHQCRLNRRRQPRCVRIRRCCERNRPVVACQFNPCRSRCPRGELCVPIQCNRRRCDARWYDRNLDRLRECEPRPFPPLPPFPGGPTDIGFPTDPCADVFCRPPTVCVNGDCIFDNFNLPRRGSDDPIPGDSAVAPTDDGPCRADSCGTCEECVPMERQCVRAPCPQFDCRSTRRTTLCTIFEDPCYLATCEAVGDARCVTDECDCTLPPRWMTTSGEDVTDRCAPTDDQDGQ